MKIQKSILLGITALSLGTIGGFTTPSNVSAHTWWDGTPSAVRGTWHTKNVYSNSLGISAHAFLKPSPTLLFVGLHNRPQRISKVHTGEKLENTPIPYMENGLPIMVLIIALQ